MNHLIELKQKSSAFLVAFGLACVGLSPSAQAVSPPPDGGYANFTTAEGDNALKALTAGVGNTAVGTFSLFSVSTGNFNTAVGAGALDLNTADSNTAIGTAALLFNTAGTENTASGTSALEFNINGNQNTANGVQALLNNASSDNTANGYQALMSNVNGSFNTATGMQALLFNTEGDSNTACGFQALFSNDTGSNNIALGHDAGLLLTTGGNNIDIGNVGAAGESNTIRIGDQATQTFTIIAGISNDIQAFGTPVIVTTDGILGVATSSARFKDEIKPMDKASEAILALRPVTFHYKKEIDPKRIPQFGLVAEDVEKVNPDLVVRDKQGKPYSVRYDAVNAMLLNEFLKEHKTVQELKANAAKQETIIAQQQKQIEALTAGLQKVSAQVQLNKPAPETVLNNR